MNNTSFIDSDGHVIKSSMVDEHQLIKITEKTPVVQNIGKIVCGDTNSNILTFEINRYYDNVDLYSKNIKFIVNNKLGIFTEDAVNIQYNDELLRFSWILSDKVTVESGNINAAIVFMGTQENKDYALKTLPFTITIEKSLDFPDSEVEYTNWFVHIENEIADLRNSNFNPGTSDSHEHSNKSILDKLSVSDDGKLLYDSEPLTPSDNDKPLSAYEIAVSEGFTGTVEEWLESLKGEPGRNGTDGTDGLPGKDGTNGNDGITPHIDPISKHWFIDSIDTGILAEGKDGKDGIDGINGNDGVDGQNGITPHIGNNGNWFIGDTDTEINAHGQDGTEGLQGKSAYDIAVENGFTGTEAEWLNSLKGEPGQDANIPQSDQTPISGSENLITSGGVADAIKNFITIDDVPTIPEHIRNITQDDIDKWNNGDSGSDVTILSYEESIEYLNSIDGSQ